MEATAAGVFAAGGAVLTKIAFGSDVAESLLRRVVSTPLSLPILLLRGACGIGLLISNGLMIHYYVKALSKSGTLNGTIINTCVNIILSSVLGYLLFNENLSVTWGIGAFVTVVGVMCILHSQPKEKHD